MEKYCSVRIFDLPNDTMAAITDRLKIPYREASQLPQGKQMHEYRPSLYLKLFFLILVAGFAKGSNKITEKIFVNSLPKEVSLVYNFNFTKGCNVCTRSGRILYKPTRLNKLITTKFADVISFFSIFIFHFLWMSFLLPQTH